MAELIPARKSFMLSYQGHLYWKHSQSAGRVYWVCRKTPECSTRAVTKGPLEHGAIPEVMKVGVHEHGANYDEVQSEKIKVNLKEKASEHPELLPSQLLRTQMQNVPPAVLSQLPDRANLTKAMQRKRLKGIPTNPKSLEELENIPEQYQKTLASMYK